ncbi:SRPBCC family protein [Nocardia cyriacigeorgica]|uniref:SRPBCC family protein n=1 Tax=Nocardia cyriacigeorgica TaxID=135487 RepID=A0A5R8NXA3_9NOCA|nr:SRPBCC family protein [Nocardia cyriacigeorgica]TLF80786.1 SRPBCC family protein [Nocardia cyriacigeorgica]
MAESEKSAGFRSILRRQYDAVAPVDDSVFDTAALVFTIERIIDAPRHAVWTAIDDDRAWSWLPFPGVGVRYDSPARGVGVVREMGSVFGIWRALWVERERFWRYEPHRRITFGVVSGSWIQYLLVRQYAEDMVFTEVGANQTKIIWTTAVTPRLPFRFAVWFPPLWRAAYRLGGIGPLFSRRVREVASLETSPSSSISTNGSSPARRGTEKAGKGTK